MYENRIIIHCQGYSQTPPPDRYFLFAKPVIEHVCVFPPHASGMNDHTLLPRQAFDPRFPPAVEQQQPGIIITGSEEHPSAAGATTTGPPDPQPGHGIGAAASDCMFRNTGEQDDVSADAV